MLSTRVALVQSEYTARKNIYIVVAEGNFLLIVKDRL